MCENYYCHSVSYKPEWLSENNWIIEYNCEIKPYSIYKGIFKINNINKCSILLSKQFLYQMNELKNILLPIIFRYNISKKNSIMLSIFITENKLDIDSKKDNLFFIKIKLNCKFIEIIHSFNSNIIQKKIKSNKLYKFDIHIENNYDLLLIHEKIDQLLDEKFLCDEKFENDKCYFLNLLIEMNDNLDNNSYFELNFE